MSRTVAIFVLASFIVVASMPNRAAAQRNSSSVVEHSWSVVGMSGEEETVFSLCPREAAPNIPWVIALHGRGETLRGATRGPHGWIVDYELPRAFRALLRRRVDAESYGNLVTAAHLREVRRRLRSQPFTGLCVVMPYAPDILSDPAAIVRYGEWIVGPLRESVHQNLPMTSRERRAIGIDGVSLGGSLALKVGFAHPDVFGAVGAIQPAIRNEERAIAERAVRARSAGPSPQRIRLLTSDEDPYRGPTERLSRLLTDRSIENTLLRLPGPHNYAFNRGPGSMELLLFHDAALE